MPVHVSPVQLSGARTKPLFVHASEPIARGDELWVAEAPWSPSSSWLRIPGKAMEINDTSSMFMPDPMVL